jgi:hypothetical protein
MTPRKLSDSDINEIIDLYRHSGETTLTLANRFDVSNSTISRILKSHLSEEEYKLLVGQKRSASLPGASGGEKAPAPEPLPPAPEVAAPAPAPTLRRSRTSRGASAESQTAFPAAMEPELLDLLETGEPQGAGPLAETTAAEASALKEMLGEELLSQEEDFSDLDEDEDEDDHVGLDEDEDDLEDLDFDTEQVESRRLSRPTGTVKVLPLSEASLPKTCYLVVDRLAELIARPLKEFGELGQIPAGEVQQKTLPVFDNHRVARRFSNRSQRVIKVPDGQILQKVSSYLQAKGITRLLIDGQVYSL